MWIKRSDVPEYLQRSSFYELLDPDDDTALEIADAHFKQDSQIHSMHELRHLLSTVRFWGVYDVPTIIMPFIMQKQVESTALTALCESFPEYCDILKNLVRVKECDPKGAIALAIQCGFGLPGVRYLHEHEGFVLSTGAYVEAAKSNDIQTLKYLRKQDFPWDAQTTISAIYANNKEILDFACVNGCALPEDAMQIAARAGHVDMMKHLHTLGIPYPATIYQGVVGLAVVIHLRAVGCRWHPSNCVHFAARNQLDCLVYAHENGCLWDAKVCAAAACYGQLRCLQYAHEQGCPWDEKTMNCAARYGHFDCLKYAHKRGCPLEATTVNSALAFSQWRCLAYLLWQSVYPADLPLVCAYLVIFLCGMLVAAVNGNMQTMYAISFCTCTMGFLLHVFLLIFGPRHLELNTQLQFHFIVLMLQVVVGLVSNITFLYMNLVSVV